MMAVPQCGFVWLSMPKCASTSVEAALEPHARIVLRGNWKHLNYTAFQHRIAPMLANGGARRGSYEVVCLFREPVDWLDSWWRYRSRPELKKRPVERKNYVGDEPFASFAERYLGRDESLVSLGRPARFCSDKGVTLGVDRIFRLESPEVWQGWLSDRVGKQLEFERRNVSARPPLEIDPGVRRRVEEFFTPEYDIYEHLRADGQWAPPKGYVPAGMS